MKDKVTTLSNVLMNLHKHLLDHERKNEELHANRAISPFEFFHLLTQDAKFAWLKPFTSLIAEVDSFTDKSQVVESKDLFMIEDKIQKVLFTSAADPHLYKSYHSLLAKSPEFAQLHESLVLALKNLFQHEKLS